LSKRKTPFEPAKCPAPTAAKSFLEDAEEVFLTNAIQGICWVECVKGVHKLFGNDLAKRLVELL
jgi:branched-subunit amino acid aminotransferase/4-amino-4-deoxychorismate lyase